MGKKGLFELFFVIIMLVLFLPVATHKTTVSTPNVLVQADQLALLTDYAVSDALADQAFVNCNTTNITSRIESYLNTLKTEFNKTSGVNCNYQTPITFICNPAGNCNNQKIRITCDSNNSTIKTMITKEIELTKSVSTMPSTDYCRVIVQSGSPGITQVDYNLSWP